MTNTPNDYRAGRQIRARNTRWGGVFRGIARTLLLILFTLGSLPAFSYPFSTLSVGGSGTGYGTVTGSYLGTAAGNCTIAAGVTSGTCLVSTIPTATKVTLTAAPAAGSSFTGWGGACGGSDPVCNVSMTIDRFVTATFTFDVNPLSVILSGTGQGSVTGNAGGINCVRATGTTSGTCMANIAAGADVTLTANPVAGTSFSGWGGACGGSSATCVVTMDAAKSVTAAFAASYTKIANDGSAVPDSAALGSGPGDWACTRDNSTGLIWEVKTADGGLRDMNKTYSNYDDPNQAQKWNGSTWVNPTPGEIAAATNSIGFVSAVNAGVLCGYGEWRMPGKDDLLGLVDQAYALMINPAYFPNTPETPYAQSSGATQLMSLFASGSSSVFNTYSIWIVDFDNGLASYGFRYYDNIYHARLVRGGLSLSTFALSVSATGAGAGGIHTGGIDCARASGVTSGICLADRGSGTVVTLTATAAPGSRFSGWDGACSGTSPTCTLTMDAAKTVTANFDFASSMAPILMLLLD